MPRRKSAALAREKKPDDHFNSVEVEIMNRLVMIEGKRYKACKIVRQALDQVYDQQSKGGLYKVQKKVPTDRVEKRGYKNDPVDDARAAEEAKVEFNLEEMDKKEAILLIFNDVLERAGPGLELVSKRIGGANIQVPVVVKQSRRVTLAIRTIVKNARARVKQMKSMTAALAAEILDIIKGTAKTLVDKENLLKMAKANAVYSGIRR